jgi:serine/threonine protein kinase/tetratricopeptide (TPR) repeat protein
MNSGHSDDPTENIDRSVNRAEQLFRLAMTSNLIEQATYERSVAEVRKNPGLDVAAFLECEIGLNRTDVGELVRLHEILMADNQDDTELVELSMMQATQLIQSVERTFIDTDDPLQDRACESTIGSTERGTPVDLSEKTERDDGGAPVHEAPDDGHRHGVSSAGQHERFRVVSVIKRGGEAIVCMARDLELKRDVAAKTVDTLRVPSLTLAELKRASERCIREAQVTGQLNHPSVIPIYALGKWASGLPFLVLPFFPRGELTTGIIQLHPEKEAYWVNPTDRDLKLRELLNSLAQVCRAVAHAHDRHIVHRDIKPSNILIGEHGEVYLADWGLAKSLAADSDDSSNFIAGASGHGSGSDETEGEVYGTVWYMSPEQAKGHVDSQNESTDIFLLGATLYSILYGKAPYRSSDKYESLRAAIACEIEFPRYASHRVDSSLIAICRKATSRKQLDRYESAMAMATDIERWLADKPLIHVQEKLEKRFVRSLRQNTRGLAASALVLLAGAIGLFIANRKITDLYQKAEIARNAETDARVVAQRSQEKEKEARLVAEKALAAETEALNEARAAQTKAERNFEQASRSAYTLYELIAKRLPYFPGTEPLRAETSETLSRIYRQLANLKPDLATYSIAATAEREAGNNYRRIDKKTEANTHYDRALKIWNALLKSDPYSPGLRLGKCLTLMDYADFQHRWGNFEAADKSFSEALALARKPNYRWYKASVIDEVELSLLITRLSHLFEVGRTADFEADFERANQIMTRWFGADGNVSFQDLKFKILLLSIEADYLVRSNRPGDAARLYEEALQISRTRKNVDQDFRSMVAGSLSGKAQCSILTGDQGALEAAANDLAEACGMLRTLMNDSPEVPFYEIRLISNSIDLMHLERKLERKLEGGVEPETGLSMIDRSLDLRYVPELLDVRARLLNEMAIREADADKKRSIAARAAIDLDRAIEMLPQRGDLKDQRSKLRSDFGV